MRSGMKHGLCIALAMGISLMIACSVSVTTNDDGTSVDFAIAGAKFSIDLGESAVFEIEADGPGVEKTFSIQLFSQVPDDRPVGATLILPAESVQVIPNDETMRRLTKDDEEEDDVEEVGVYIDVYMADANTDNPCQDGVYVGRYEGTLLAEGFVFTNSNELPIADSMNDAVRSGLFNMCVKVSGRVTGRVYLDEFQVKFTEETEDADTTDDDNTVDGTGTDDNAGDDTANDADDDAADDGDSDDTADDSADDNTADDDADDLTDEDTDEDVDPLDPDGDGNFADISCDAHGWVNISAESPPRYSGSEGNETCSAKIHFENVGSGNIVIWWHVIKEVPSTGTITEDGWYSTGLAPGEETDSVSNAWSYSAENNTLLHVVTSEVMVSRYDNEYYDGCYWLSNAIRDDDSDIELTRLDVTTINPCE